MPSVLDLRTNGRSILLAVAQIIALAPTGHFPSVLHGCVMSAAVAVIDVVLILVIRLEIVVAVLRFVQCHRVGEPDQLTCYVVVASR